MEPQTLFIRPPVGAILAAVVIGGIFYLGGKQIETHSQNLTTINVNGEGKVSVPPDIASLNFGHQTGRQATAASAMQMLKKNMDSVIAAVKGAGVADKDLTTEQFSLNPSYDYTNGRQNIIGYEASQTLRAKVRNLDKVSDVLGAATAAGANQAGSVEFTVDDPAKARADARTKAIAQAKQKAQQLADELGMTLGTLKGFNESTGGQAPVPMMRADYAAGAAAKESVQLPAGDQDVVVDVALTYELH